jgi:hypothetical protein
LLEHRAKGNQDRATTDECGEYAALFEFIGLGIHVMIVE